MPNPGYAAGLGALSEADARELMARVASGDRAAWAQLYEHGRAHVARYLSRRMAEQTDVDDVVHDTFVRLPEMAKQFAADDAGEVGAWLCGRVARYTLAEYGHRRFRHQSAVGASIEAQHLPAPESTEERESRPLSPRMVTALAQLSPSQRRSMQLRYLDDLTEVDAAQASGVTRSAVAQNCAKARRHLREALADLAPQSRSWLDGLSKKQAVHVAFGEVGADDVPQVMTWLHEHGLRVTHSYVCGIRKGRFGPVPAVVAKMQPDVVTGPAAHATSGFVPDSGHAAEQETATEYLAAPDDLPAQQQATSAARPAEDPELEAAAEAARQAWEQTRGATGRERAQRLAQFRAIQIARWRGQEAPTVVQKEPAQTGDGITPSQSAPTSGNGSRGHTDDTVQAARSAPDAERELAEACTAVEVAAAHAPSAVKPDPAAQAALAASLRRTDEALRAAAAAVRRIDAAQAVVEQPDIERQREREIARWQQDEHAADTDRAAQTDWEIAS